MRGMFTFTLHGRVAAEPECSKLQNGKDRTVALVVVNVPWKGQDGKWNEDTSWVRIAWFGPQAVRLAERLHKGSIITCEGEVKSYQQEFGDKKFTSYNFKPRSTSIVDPQEERAGSQPQRGGRRPSQARDEAEEAAGSGGAEVPYSEDLPF